MVFVGFECVIFPRGRENARFEGAWRVRWVVLNLLFLNKIRIAINQTDNKQHKIHKNEFKRFLCEFYSNFILKSVDS